MADHRSLGVVAEAHVLEADARARHLEPDRAGPVLPTHISRADGLRIVDRRLSEAAAAGYEIVGPCDDGPPVGYWGIIVDPDGHNLERQLDDVGRATAVAMGEEPGRP